MWPRLTATDRQDKMATSILLVFQAYALRGCFRAWEENWRCKIFAGFPLCASAVFWSAGFHSATLESPGASCSAHSHDSNSGANKSRKSAKARIDDACLQVAVRSIKAACNP